MLYLYAFRLTFFMLLEKYEKSIQIYIFNNIGPYLVQVYLDQDRYKQKLRSTIMIVKKLSLT